MKMKTIHDSKKVGWFEEFVYQLVKKIHHLDFHKERETQLNRYRTINSAVIKIFAYRLTYENFEMLRNQIAQTAQEIVSEKVLAQLKELGSSGEENLHNNASNLVKIILLLLHEEADKYLMEDEALDIYLEEEQTQEEEQPLDICLEEEQEEAEPDVCEKRGKRNEKGKEGTESRWMTSSSGDRLLFRGDLLDDLSKHLAEYEQKKAVSSVGKLKDKEADEFFEDKDEAESEEAAANLENVESQVENSLDRLIGNLGEEGLDDLIFGKKSTKNGDEGDNEDLWMDWID